MGFGRWNSGFRVGGVFYLLYESHLIALFSRTASASISGVLPENLLLQYHLIL